MVLLKVIYVIKVVQPPFFLSSLSCSILNPANKHGIPAYMPTYLSVKAYYLSESVVSKVTPASSHSSGYISSFGSTGGGSVDILMY